MSNHLRFALATLVFSLTCSAVAASDLVVEYTRAQTATTSNEKAQADKLFQEGVQQYRRGEYQKALATYQQVLEIRRLLNDKAGIAQALNNIGQVYNNLPEREKEALEVLQQAYSIRRELKDRKGEGETLDNIGTVYNSLDQNDKALATLQQAYSIRREVHDRGGEGVTLRKIGITYSHLKQHPKALELLQQARAIHQEVGDKYQLGITIFRIGIVYKDINDDKNALLWFNQALALNREIGNRAIETSSLMLIGGVYSSQKQYDRSLEYYKQALPVAQAISNKSLVFLNLQQLSNIYDIKVMDYYVRGLDKQAKIEANNAIEMAQSTLKLARELKKPESEATVLEQLSHSYSVLGENQKALELAKQALKIARELKSLDLEGRIFTSLDLISSNQASKISNYDVRGLVGQAKVEAHIAIEIAQSVLNLARELKKPESEATALKLLIDSYIVLGENQKALELAEQALKIAREIKNIDIENNILNSFVSIYENQGEDKFKILEIRKRLVEIAREQKNPSNEAAALLSLGSSYNSVSEYQLAISTFQEALAVAQKIEVNKLPLSLQESVQYTQLNALDGLSRSYRGLGEIDKALDFAQQRVKKAQSFNNPKHEAEALLDLSFMYSNTFNDNPKSIDAAQQALSIARKIKEQQIEANALKQLGDNYQKQGNYAKALEASEQLLSIAKQLNNSQIEFDALLILRDVYQAQGDLKQALLTAQQIVTITQQKNLGIYEGHALIKLSESYLSVGDTTKAMESAQQALTIAKKQNNPAMEALALNDIAMAYKLRGEYQQGIAASQQALDISSKNKYLPGEITAVYHLAIIYEALGEYQKLIAITEPYLPRLKQLNNRYTEAQLLSTVGSAYNSIGANQKGTALVEQSLAIARELKNPALESTALHDLGSIYNSRSEYQKALELTQQSLKIAQDLQSPPLKIAPLSTLASIYNNLGDYNKSREYYQQVLTNAKTLQNRRTEGAVSLDIASTYFAQDQPQKTVELSQQALTIFREIKEPRLEAFAHRMLSVGYGELGNDAKAMEEAQNFLTFARKVKNPMLEKFALTNLGSLHRKFGRKQDAIIAYQQALALGGDSSIYAGLAFTYRDLNQTNIAIGYYKQAINSIDQVRRNIEGLPPELQKSFLLATVDFDNVKTIDIYRQLADLLLKENRENEAPQVIELIKNQELKDVTIGAKITLTSDENKIATPNPSIIALSNQISECEKANCKEKSQLNDKLTVLVKEFDTELKKIDSEISERIAKDPGAFDPGKLGKAREVVKAQPNTVMIYPLVLEDKLWLVMYSGDAVKKFEVKVSRSELGNTVKQFRTLMEECERKPVCDSTDITKLQPVSQKLYTWLIKPFEPELKQNQVKNLVFALDRVTRYIPMSALYDGQKYLIENYTVYNILSADLTNTTDKLPTQPQLTRVLAMGVSEAKGGFPALKNVPKELSGILTGSNNRGSYPGKEYLNSAFDFRALRDNLANNKILHLATHGVFVPDIKDGSYLLLGNGNKLGIPEITALTGLSNIHLVVLSACQTALAGPRQDGVEIASVAYYFLNNGAKAVMASLWQVADESTSNLMQDFYLNMAREEKPTKALALRLAQLSLLYGKQVTLNDIKRGIDVIPADKPARQTPKQANFAHPYYWAPFILIGNGL